MALTYHTIPSSPLCLLRRVFAYGGGGKILMRAQEDKSHERGRKERKRQGVISERFFCAVLMLYLLTFAPMILHNRAKKNYVR